MYRTPNTLQPTKTLKHTSITKPDKQNGLKRKIDRGTNKTLLQGHN